MEVLQIAMGIFWYNVVFYELQIHYDQLYWLFEVIVIKRHFIIMLVIMEHTYIAALFLWRQKVILYDFLYDRKLYSLNSFCPYSLPLACTSDGTMLSFNTYTFSQTILRVVIGGFFNWNSSPIQHLLPCGKLSPIVMNNLLLLNSISF